MESAASVRRLPDFEGRHALVTGAADGIGLALARGFGRAGLRVVLVDVRGEAVEEAARALRTEGIDARGAAADVSDRVAVESLAERLAGEGVVPSLVWINAGVGVGATVLDANERLLHWVLGVNVLGAIWTAQAFTRRLRGATGPRHVGFTASSASLHAPEAPFTLYATSKVATGAVAEAVRSELAGDGIGVTILCPGLLNTRIWNAGRARPDRFGGPVSLPEAIGERWRAARDPDVVVGPVLARVAAGGGYCVIPTEAATRELFEARHDAIARGFVGDALEAR